MKNKVMFIIFIIPNYILYRKLLKLNLVNKGFLKGFFNKEENNKIGME